MISTTKIGLPVVKNMSTAIKKVTMMNINKYLKDVLTKASKKAFPLDENFKAHVNWNTNNNSTSSDLSSPVAIKIFTMNAKKEGWYIPSSKEVAQEIITNIEEDNEKVIGEVLVSQMVSGKKEKEKNTEDKTKTKSNLIENTDNSNEEDNKKKVKVEISHFYIDFKLNDKFVERMCNQILKEGIYPETRYTGRKVLVDFSSPNIAKEMHVGHLRSTILGDAMCNILEYLKNDVKRINHVGDWGTQFGLLIANLEEEYPDYLANMPQIKDLEHFYVKAKKRFESDEKFKKHAHEKTVLLQRGDPQCRIAWEFICDISRKEFNKIYSRLNIRLEEMGESFYSPYCRELILMLEEQKYLIEDKGAKIIKVLGFKIPLMIVKSDGGFTYDTSDLTALWYRLIQMERDWVIYVVGSEQELHLRLIFEFGKLIGWHKPPYTRLDHMSFGLMLQANGGKISTRDGGLVKLSDLLDEAKRRAKEQLRTRNSYNEDYIEEASGKIGYSAIKYFDLKQNRTSTYKFSFDKMLDINGNTAVYLFYCYVRICSIYAKAKLTEEDIDKLITQSDEDSIIISNPKERALLIHLLKFNDVIEEVLEDLSPNKLCDFLYGTAVKFSEFYEECKIVGDEKMKQRILIVELTRRFMKLGFDLLGLTPVEKI